MIYTDTQAALVDAVKGLVREQGLAKTTVLQISQRAGLNRKTFYKHFRDKYELVNWICYQEWSEFSISPELQDDWAFVSSIAGFFEKDRVFYGTALEDCGQNSFGSYITDNFTKAISSSMYDMFHFFGIDDNSIVYVAGMLARMFRESMAHWLLYEEDVSSAEYFKSIEVATNAFVALICEYNRYAGIECPCDTPGIPQFSAEKLGGVRLRKESEMQ